ncbi:NADH dehydrogenase (ubiquinone) B14 subunit [Megalopta genalis]|uniref:NADH dehydrogenase (ubiquinone) B14 subunit n=1 Tax=Megalopta genalis TaxID=115081 RepID=UPI003FD14B46
MAATAIKLAVKKVKPILSINREDAHRRVIALYKAYYRQIPQTMLDYDIPKSVTECRKKLKEEFLKNQHVVDIRVIDILVLKGQMQLQEVSQAWIPKGRLMDVWKETEVAKPTDFMSKFLSGQDTVI